MPRAIPRDYISDRDDLPRMREILQQRWLETAPEPGDLHSGDLFWQRYQHVDSVSRWSERVRLWEANGEPVGFSIFYPRTDEIGLFLRSTEWEGNVHLIGEMMADGLVVAKRFDDAGETKSSLSVAAFDGGALAGACAALGAAPSEQAFLRMNAQTLSSDDDLTGAEPDGWTVRSVRGPEEYAGRVEAHLAAFDPSRVTVDAYQRLRAVSAYDPELDLVAVNADGVIASFALGWFDAPTRTGLFEPVGCLPDFRRRGLTRAVLLEGLRRLRSLGATRAYVNSLEESDAANGLYQSAGFRPVRRWRLYEIPTG